MQKPSEHSNQIRAHVFVSGIVQGVGYRYSTAKKANQLGINGWVKNLQDGRVEAVFEGTPMNVEAMIRWCYEGSQGAVVEHVAVESEPPEGREGFEIKR